MEIQPERSGRNPGEEELPRTEIPASAREVAGVLRDMNIALEHPDDERSARLIEHRIQLADRGTSIDWEAYGTFSIDVSDRLAPPSIRGRVFHADLEAEHFHYGDSADWSPARRALGLLRHLDPGGRRKRRQREIQNRLPVPDHLAKELLAYLQKD